MIFVLANNNNPGLESAAYNKSFYGNLHKWLINKCLEQVLYMFVLLALIEKTQLTPLFDPLLLCGVSQTNHVLIVFTLFWERSIVLGLLCSFKVV